MLAVAVFLAAASVGAQSKVDQGKPGTQGPWPVTGVVSVDGGFISNMPPIDQTGAFGETLTVANQPVVWLSTPYDLILPEVVASALTGSGSLIADGGHFILSVSDAGSSASMRSVETARYLPGQGMVSRFTFVSSGCAAGQQQLIGTGGLGVTGTDGGGGDGFFFGCCATCETDGGYAFGVMRRNSFMATDTWVPASQWNGVWGTTAPDITKGRPWQIVFQWLGYGQVSWFTEDPTTGRFVLVHALKYAGTSTDTTISNPVLPLGAQVKNFSSNAVNTLRTPSMALLRQGLDSDVGLRRSASASITSSATEARVFGLQNVTTITGKTNRIAVRLDHITWSIGSPISSDVTIRLRMNPGVTSPTYTPISGALNASVIGVDTSGTYAPDGGFYGNGVDIIEFISQGSQVGVHALAGYGINVLPGQVLVVTAQASSGTPTVRVSLSWVEER
ncbi:MAG: hypothetical protein WAV09_03345 [Minisyncoccia bacterium]